MALSVSLSVSVDSQLMWFNCNSLLPVPSIPGGLKLFLHLFALDLCVFGALVCYFCIDL